MPRSQRDCQCATYWRATSGMPRMTTTFSEFIVSADGAKLKEPVSTVWPSTMIVLSWWMW
ncbi:hypothetical protein D3C72_2519360 [compost metagenome]